MLAILNKLIKVDERDWTVFYPEYCQELLGQVEEDLKQKDRLKKESYLKPIEYKGASYHLAYFPNEKQCFLGSQFFSDEFLLKVNHKLYAEFLEKVKNKKIGYQINYELITSYYKLEDLFGENHKFNESSLYKKLVKELASKTQSYHKSFFEKLTDLALFWTAEYEVIRLYLLKFLAILPCLDHDQTGREVKIILLENLRRLKSANKANKRKPLPWFLSLSLDMVYGLSKVIPQFYLAKAIRFIVKILASRFIAGEDISEATKGIEQLKKTSRSVTIDQLGELVLSDKEADQYYQKVINIINGLKNHYPQGERNRAGIFNAHVSIKVSALCGQFNIYDYEFTYQQIAPRLIGILQKAAIEKVFINIDAEHYHSRDMILKIYGDCLEKVIVEGYQVESGIVLQAYLVDGAKHLQDILALSEKLRYKMVIRLVKGAYWDAETIEAKAHHYLPPQFINKEETDLHFRQLAIEVLKCPDFLHLTIASHNILDHCWVRSVWEEYFKSSPEIEHQCLHMTYEALSHALAKMNWATRNYIPVGDLLVGMAYLVRRIMENSSQVGILQIMRSHEKINSLKEPQKSLQSKIESKGYFSYEDFFDHSCKFKNVSPIRPYKNHHYEALKSTYKNYETLLPRELSQEGIHIFSPSHKNLYLGSYEQTSQPELLAMIKKANTVWEKGSAWLLDFDLRCGVLTKLSHLILINRLELSAMISFEAGKSVAEALADVDEAIDFIRFYLRVYDEEKNKPKALGLIAVIAPWNFPLAIACGMSIGALVSGNITFLKPSEHTPLIAKEFYRLALLAGVPREVFYLILGDGEQGQLLAEAEEIDGIVFTGSKKVGESLFREYGLKRLNRHGKIRPVIAEMGGKNPIIITNNCELDETVEGVLYSCFAHGGQKCSAASRLIIHKEVKENFLQRFIEAAGSMKIGRGDDFSTYMNPLINQHERQRVKAIGEKLKKEVRQLGGHIHLDSLSGLQGQEIFTGPMVIEIPREKALQGAGLFHQEFFAPIIHIVEYSKPEEAVALANGTQYALTVGVFAQSQDNIDYYSHHLDGGNLYINRPNTGARVGIEPFGGYKMSGTGPKAGSPSYLRSFYQKTYGFHDLALSENIEKAFRDYKNQHRENTHVPNQKSFTEKKRLINSLDCVVMGEKIDQEIRSFLKIALDQKIKISLYINKEHVNYHEFKESSYLNIFHELKGMKPSQLVLASEKQRPYLLENQEEFTQYLPRFYTLKAKEFTSVKENEFFDLFIYEKSYAVNIMRHGAPLEEV